jgi:hypothetical protein
LQRDAVHDGFEQDLLGVGDDVVGDETGS